MPPHLGELPVQNWFARKGKYFPRPPVCSDRMSIYFGKVPRGATTKPFRGSRQPSKYHHNPKSEYTRCTVQHGKENRATRKQTRNMRKTSTIGLSRARAVQSCHQRRCCYLTVHPFSSLFVCISFVCRIVNPRSHHCLYPYLKSLFKPGNNVLWQSFQFSLFVFKTSSHAFFAASAAELMQKGS